MQALVEKFDQKIRPRDDMDRARREDNKKQTAERQQQATVDRGGGRREANANHGSLQPGHLTHHLGRALRQNEAAATTRWTKNAQNKVTGDADGTQRKVSTVEELFIVHMYYNTNALCVTKEGPKPKPLLRWPKEPKEKSLTNKAEQNECPHLETTPQQGQTGVHHPQLGVAEDLRHLRCAACGEPAGNRCE